MEKEFKGTKGEWFVNGLFIECEGEDGLTTVCQFYDRFETEFEDAKSNAQLIATAPELLKALQNLMKGVEGLPPLTAIAGLLENEYREAEKAINKALGL